MGCVSVCDVPASFHCHPFTFLDDVDDVDDDADDGDKKCKTTTTHYSNMEEEEENCFWNIKKDVWNDIL